MTLKWDHLLKNSTKKIFALTEKKHFLTLFLDLIILL